MDKETLSNYGWIVIAVLVLVVMIALATPFGKFVSQAVQNTTKGLFDVSQNALNAANVPGLSIEDQEFDMPDGTNKTPVYDHNAPELHPDDGSTPQSGNIHTYGDYEYCYGYSLCSNCGDWSDRCGCPGQWGFDGWAVRCINNVADPGPILESINGEPVTSMENTFYECTNLTTIPVIPESVTNMSETFSNCTSLTDLSTLTIPANVTSMLGTFSNCTGLTNLSTLTIPANVTSMFSAFSNCTGLTDLSTLKIPESVTDISNTFSNCTGLTDLSTFTIPASVTEMSSTFAGCTNLTTAPVIPANVTDMFYTFMSCTSLTGTITINANPAKYNYCFIGTALPIVLTGSSTMLSELAATGGDVTVQQ